MAENPLENPTTLEGSVDSPVKAQAVRLVAAVRAFLRDYPELNRLTNGVESSDRQIAFAVAMAIDDWNLTPPLIGGVNIMSFPSFSLLVQGTVVFLLQSLGLFHLRNGVAYSDGNMSLNLDKNMPIMQWLNMFISAYEQRKRQTKIAMNLNNALGDSSIPSEYANFQLFFD